MPFSTPTYLDQKQETLREEEKELIMNLSPAYLEWEKKTLNQGKQEGIRLGEQQALEQIARKLLAADMDPAQIAAITGLAQDWSRQLQPAS